MIEPGVTVDYTVNHEYLNTHPPGSNPQSEVPETPFRKNDPMRESSVEREHDEKVLNHMTQYEVSGTRHQEVDQ